MRDRPTHLSEDVSQWSKHPNKGGAVEDVTQRGDDRSDRGRASVVQEQGSLAKVVPAMKPARHFPAASLVDRHLAILPRCVPAACQQGSLMRVVHACKLLRPHLDEVERAPFGTLSEDNLTGSKLARGERIGDGEPLVLVESLQG